MEKELVTMMVSDIIPYENNPRKNDKAVGMVAESISQTGYNNPIIVDEDNVILAGHTRLKSLKKLGEKEVQVLRVSGMSDEEKRKYRLLDNKTGEFASWDYVALMEELNGLEWGEMDIDWGIGEDESYDEDDNGKTKNSDEEKPEFEYECPECGYRFNA